MGQYNIIILISEVNVMTRRKKTDAEFKKEIYDLVGDEYTFLDSYATARTRIRVRHNECGKVYEVTPSNFLRGNRCPYCSGKTKKTDAQFKQEVKSLVGDEYTFLDDYINNSTKIKVKHNNCGTVYKVLPSNFLRGRRCPYCNGNAKKTNIEFKKEVYDLVGSEYTFLDDYVNANTKIRVKHNRCGHIYKVTPHSFLNGTCCPKCFGTPKKTNEQFKKEVFDLVGDEYTFLETYVNNHTKLMVKHTKCGHVYKVTPTDFFNKHSRCPYCNSPKGETIISKILNNLNISYEPQKIFSDLKDAQPLSYDFYIPDQSILIEYQGIQHYEPVDFFGSDSAFKKQQKHDKLKSDYAKDHGYMLIAVPYTEDTFSKIKKYLSKHGLKLH